MMKIESIWQELEEDLIPHPGILYKRYSSSVVPYFYVALRAPENLRCVAALILKENKPEIQNWSHLKDIRVELFNDKNIPDKVFLLIILLNPIHKDIFSVLCEDLIIKVSQISDEKDLISTILNRLAKWEDLFDSVGQQGLSEEAQRGLFGELTFLKKQLSFSEKLNSCISSWMGPSGAVQDFQDGNWAVEVKTTHGKNHQKLHISNERQLDNSVIPDIYIYHLSIDERKNSGITLNDIIKSIKSHLSIDSIAFNSFNLKLHDAGYFDIHFELYENKGYNMRQENYYIVNDVFPRITEKDLMQGVGDVKYTVIVSENPSFILNESDLFDRIKF